ncbi:phage holin family protein [Labedella phragmitis]|uniref:Phage holin family protein n=1 Tax=Labedella phragmitis TaxID=2498849 RepID=A0A3S3ZCS7_9MICO|nr:phage holin family protein [Labedella phragmitis]RWZ52695.1 phage holin family protein [Labedella phragmitis]
MSRYTTETPTRRSKEQVPLLDLITSIPGLLKRLLTAELDGLKGKASHIGKNAGIGAGLVVVALMFLFFALGTLVAVGILALALVMPAWLAALIVFVVFLLIAGVLVLIALRFFRKISEGPSPSDEFQKDIRAVKGVGEYDRH